MASASSSTSCTADGGQLRTSSLPATAGEADKRTTAESKTASAESSSIRGGDDDDEAATFVVGGGGGADIVENTDISSALLSHKQNQIAATGGRTFSFSDRRHNNNNKRRGNINNNRAVGSSSARMAATATNTDANRKNMRQSEKSLYASFKFIDDNSPSAAIGGGGNKSRGDSLPLNQSLAGQLDQQYGGGAAGRRFSSVRPSIDSMSGSLEVQCGIGPYRPSCLQKFANKSWMLFWLCWFCAVQGMLVSGLVPSVLSTIERRFNFRAASLGRIMQWYDIGYALCCVPVSYFGGRHSKPVFIGVGLLIMGLGSFIFSLPHIISGAPIIQPKTENIGTCAVSAAATKSERGAPLSALFSSSSSSHQFDHAQMTIADIAMTANFTESGSPLLSLSPDCGTIGKRPEGFFSGMFPGSYQFEVLFCFAHLLHGIGATPLFTLGVSYIDENVKPTLSSLYVAIFYTFVIIGPAAGFLMSGAFLRFHTTFLSTRPADIEIDETDPEWVGAWWIGFQIASILSLFAVFPILSFPKSLPGALKWQLNRMHRNASPVDRRRHSLKECDEKRLGGGSSSSRRCSKGTVVVSHYRAPTTTAAAASSCSTNNDPCTSAPLPPSYTAPAGLPATTTLIMDDINGGGADAKSVPLLQRLLTDLRHMPGAVRRLVTNPAYMCITLAASVEGLLIAGLSGFMAKYLERQFNVASSRANMLIGCIMVPVAGLGTLASGYIVKRFRLTCPRTLKFCIAMAVCSLVLSPMFLVLCEPTKLSGIQVPYPTDVAARINSTSAPNHQYTFSLNSQCNSHCACTEEDFRPVCGTVNNEQTTFFTSCYAGCSEQYGRSKKVYNNCTCVDGNKVTAGWCESKCSALIGFLILFAPMCLSTFSIGVPALSVILRCVDYNERSFALGIQWILIRCIGTIPAPAIFAWLFDISCLKRRKSAADDAECGGSSLTGAGAAGDELADGSCYIYDNKLLADLFLAFALIGQTVTLIFLILASLFYRSNGREDLIVSEAPPPPPPVPAASNVTALVSTTIATEGEAAEVATDAAISRKSSVTVKRLG